MFFKIFIFILLCTGCVHQHSVGPVRIKFISKEGSALKDLPISVRLLGHETKSFHMTGHGAFTFFDAGHPNDLYKAYIFTDINGFITIEENMYEIWPGQYGPYSIDVHAVIGSMCKGERLKHAYSDSPFATSRHGWGSCIETKAKETFATLPSEITCRVQLSSKEITAFIEKNPFDPGVCESGYYHNKY